MVGFGPLTSAGAGWHAAMVRSVEENTTKTVWGKTQTTDWYWTVYGDSGHAVIDSETTLDDGLAESTEKMAILVPAW